MARWAARQPDPVLDVVDPLDAGCVLGLDRPGGRTARGEFRTSSSRARPSRYRPKRLRRRPLPGFEKQLCFFQIGSAEAFGESVVDGLKNLGGAGSIFPPDQ